MLQVDVAHDAQKFVRRLGAKQQRQIAECIQRLRVNPEPSDSIALKGMPGVRRVDQGEYRIGYTFSESLLKIEAIGPRNDDDIYKTLKRKFT